MPLQKLEPSTLRNSASIDYGIQEKRSKIKDDGGKHIQKGRSNFPAVGSQSIVLK